jgi:hypothetical protein
MAGSGIALRGGVVTAITAKAGGVGTDTNHTAANTAAVGVNVVSVCATAGDSIMLPANAPLGAEVTIINTAAAVCDVTPNVGGTINGGAVQIQRGLAASTGATFIQVAADGLTWVADNTTAPTA